MAGSYGTNAGTLTEGLCQNTQIAFNEAFAANDPQRKMEMLGTLRGIMENNTGVQKHVDSGDGSRNEATTASKNVVALFNPRFHRGGASTTLTDGCATGDTPAPCEVIFSANNPIESQTITMNEWEYRRICEGAASYQENRLVALADQVIERLNFELAGDLVGLTGNFKDASASKTYTILNSDGSQRFSGGTNLHKDLAEALAAGTVNIIGWGNWYDYAKNAAAGGLADTGQLMNQSADGMRFYYDPNVADASVHGDEDTAFVVMQDSLAFHTWNGFKGEYRRLADDEIKTTFVHPSGIELDLFGWYDKCEAGKNAYESGNWSFRYSLHYGLAGIPAGIWKADDPHYGINYVFQVVGNQAP